MRLQKIEKKELFSVAKVSGVMSQVFLLEAVTLEELTVTVMEFHNASRMFPCLQGVIVQGVNV